MFKEFLDVFETLFSFSTIDEKWTIMFSKNLIILRSRILSIVHSVDHERKKSFSKKIERVRSITKLKEIRKCRRQTSFIKSLMKRFINEAYWWSIFTNFLNWCVKTVVSRNISVNWICRLLKNVKMFAEDFQIRKSLTVNNH